MARYADLDKVLELVNEVNEDGNFTSYAHYSYLFDSIDNLPTIEQPQWIPCSERLPKYPYRVQIQLDNGWIITGYYSEEHWYTVPHCGVFLRSDEVEAWRELPEPYGGSDAK